MKNALIGYSGFVGSTLRKQTKFDFLYRSTNIAEIEGNEFDIVVCAGAPAQKWLANKEPEHDFLIINGLIQHLQSIHCKKFILISTVDVFKTPINVSENTVIDENNLHPYGLHRRYLEKFVESHFDDYLIVRLPGLVGPGLRKNIIFDFLNNNNVNQIDSRNIFQFYPMVNLWSDIQTALNQQLKLVHLTSEPISVSEVAENGFGFKFENVVLPQFASYDMKSEYAHFYQGKDYQYTKKDVLLAIRAYAQSEPKTDR